MPANRRHPNIHLAQTSPSNFVEKIKKTCKNLLTKVILLAIIIKLSREPSPRRQPLEPLPTACTPFFEENFFKKLSENLLTNERIWYIIYKLSRKRDSAAGPWKLNKTETCGTLIVGLETHVNQFQNLQVIHTGRKRLCLSDYRDLTLLNGD